MHRCDGLCDLSAIKRCCQDVQSASSARFSAAARNLEDVVVQGRALQLQQAIALPSEGSREAARGRRRLLRSWMLPQPGDCSPSRWPAPKWTGGGPAASRTATPTGEPLSSVQSSEETFVMWTMSSDTPCGQARLCEELLRALRLGPRFQEEIQIGNSAVPDCGNTTFSSGRRRNGSASIIASGDTPVISSSRYSSSSSWRS